jgi:phosphoribosylaminoimidazole-succinocarboxamide synthase
VCEIWFRREAFENEGAKENVWIYERGRDRRETVVLMDNVQGDNNRITITMTESNQENGRDVTCVGGVRNAYSIFVGSPKG